MAAIVTDKYFPGSNVSAGSGGVILAGATPVRLTRIIALTCVLLLAAMAQGQTHTKLGKQTDSTLLSSLNSMQISLSQKVFFDRILQHRTNDLKKRIDSANYDYLILEEEINTSKETYRTVGTFIAKGFVDRVCVDDKYNKPHPDYKGVSDTDSKLIHSWPYRTIDTLYPEAIVFTQGCIATPTKKTKRKMDRAGRKEKRSGGYLPPVYRIVTMIDMKTNVMNIAFFIPKKSIREVKFVCISGP